MIGGFGTIGTPEKIIDGLVESNKKNLTLIANDTGLIGKGIGKLIVNKQVKKAIVSHVGTNPETGRQMINGEIEVEFSPQGTLAERIRCGGAGIAGFFTPTGVGTLVEEGKEKKDFDGKTYILETALRADVAIIKAHKADTFGNLVFYRTACNFNPLLATAAEKVIAEVEEIVEVGSLGPDEIMLSGIFVDYIFKG
jgi:acetate CoA/acetoacetate CoA-transferase alpha subunit